MIDELKELEQEAMDNMCPDRYERVTQDFMQEEDMEVYQCGYIDGLRTAIRLLSEDDSTMSYTMEIDEMFGEDYARTDTDEE